MRTDDCKICHGDGELKCPGCDGGGAIKRHSDSDVPRWESCARCKGKGKIECPMCDGTGET